MTQYPAELTGSYTLDPSHSRFGFVARHAMVTKVRGQFNEVEGTAKIDAADPSNSSATVTIKVGSVETGSEQRDEHLRNSDFFEVETFPEITFVSTAVEATDDGFNVTGDLTIKDVTKSLTFPLEFGGSATDPWGNTRIGFEGSVQVKRSDWNLNWNTPLDGGGVLVSEKVTLEFDVSATKDA